MKKFSPRFSKIEKHRIFELVGTLFLVTLLLGVSRLESRLLTLSQRIGNDPESSNQLVYFSLVNFNVVIVLVLCFLIFRNVAKLLVERRHGVIGSKLKSKIIVTLVFFSVAPTVLMFYVASVYVVRSFDTWFSKRVQHTVQSTKELGAQIYTQDRKRLESLARLALQRIEIEEHKLSRTPPLRAGQSGFPPTIRSFAIDTQKLGGFNKEYQLDFIGVYDMYGVPVYESAAPILTNLPRAQDELAVREVSKDDVKKDDSEVEREVPKAEKNIDYQNPVIARMEHWKELIREFSASPATLSLGEEEPTEGRDIVRAVAPVTTFDTAEVIGLVVVETHFKTNILQNIEAILIEFSRLRSTADMNRLTYLVLLILMVLMIGFATTWLGFYVARKIVEPVQDLAAATREVAGGNYNISLPEASDDETGMLIRAFQKMAEDLKEHEIKNQRFTSELQSSYKELESRKNYTEIVLNNITTGVVSLAMDTTVTSINQAAEDLLSVSRESVVGRKVTDGFSGVLVENLWKPIIRTLEESKESEKSFVISAEINSAQAHSTLTVSVSRLIDSEKSPVGMVIVLDDASETARAQRLAAWKEVARRIAHEIKNPITPIKLSAERLERRYGKEFEARGEEVFSQCIHAIVSQVDTLKDLVNEFSRFSRMPETKFVESNLNEMVQSVVNAYKMSFSDVVFHVSEGDAVLTKVQFDPENMKRALMNLVSNAVEAVMANSSELGKSITVKTEFVVGIFAARIEVIDNGCGISQEQKARVFDPYFSTKKEGTGLGLAIVYQIVTEHGGYVRVTDVAPRGTKFTIEIPIKTKGSPLRILDRSKV